MSNQPKHTPGPWILEQDAAGIYVVEPNSGIGPCCIPTNGDDMRDEDLANARLIAASPDLLAKLIEFIDVLEKAEINASGTNVDLTKTLVEAKNILARTTGGSNE